MSGGDDYLRGVKDRTRRGRRLEPEQPAKPAPLVTQGARSEPPRPTPPSIDDLIRNARAWRTGGPLWTRIT